MKAFERNGIVYCIVTQYESGAAAQYVGERLYDAFVVCIENGHTADNMHYVNEIVSWLAGSNSDWVEIFGTHSEAIHDMIDEASVRAGRQSHVGCGKPMTAWHEMPTDWHGLCEYIVAGGMGYMDIKVIVLVGSSGRVSSFVDEYIAQAFRPPHC